MNEWEKLIPLFLLSIAPAIFVTALLNFVFH
jgi:hypothetical protein